jgi:CRP-like cAMP-binding protein
MKTIPDRLSVDPKSPHFKGKKWAAELRYIFLDGKEIDTVVEYCISEGWVRQLVRDANGKFVVARDRQSLETTLVRGVVEVLREKKQ